MTDIAGNSLPGKIAQLTARPFINAYDAAHDLASVLNSYGKTAKTWKGATNVLIGAA